MDSERAIRKLLYDVKTAIGNIQHYIGEKTTFAAYEQDPLLRDAVERNLITIGEAVRELKKIDEAIPISHDGRFVHARNKLAHGYDKIEPMLVWSIIWNQLPVLSDEVEQLMKK